MSGAGSFNDGRFWVTTGRGPGEGLPSGSSHRHQTLRVADPGNTVTVYSFQSISIPQNYGEGKAMVILSNSESPADTGSGAESNTGFNRNAVSEQQYRGNDPFPIAASTLLNSAMGSR
jgi:hypothetical protein